MGVKFTNPADYLMGVCSATFRNTETGDVEYWTDKVTDFEESQSSNEVVIRSGMLNPISTIINTDSDMQVTATTAAYSMKMQMMQIGGSYGANGIVPRCKTVVASGTSLTIDVSDGTPVAAPGYSDIFCHVQTVGAAGTIENTGDVYALDASTGAISGFTATASTQYKVWYWVNEATAQSGVVYGAIMPGVYNVTFQQPIFRNITGNANEGTRVGWLYRVYPMYRLAGSTGSAGSQTSNGTTNLSGRVLTYDEDTISATCDDCTTGISAYYFAVYDDNAEAIEGLALIGGVITVPQGGTAQADVKVALAGGGFATPDPAFMTYSMTTAITGVSVSATGLLTATGSASGDGELTATYNDGTNTFTLPVNVTVAV